MLNIQQLDGQSGSNEISERVSSSRQLTPQEEALQTLCKHILKSRLFRGFYLERRFVNSLNDYRDIISLQRSEKELEKLLLDIARRLEMFYAQTTTPNIWIGLTHGPLVGANLQAGALETYLWVELDELAFGQYWFSIKSIRFRQNEIILKLKVVREFEDEKNFTTPIRANKRTEIPTGATAITTTTITTLSTTDIKASQALAPLNRDETLAVAHQINWEDFIEILKNWGIAIKQTIYEFMAHDINKENLKSLLQLFGLLILSIISGSIAGIKFLGIFTLRFMHEFSRLTHVMTPIVLQLIEVFNKIIGGFYILIAMIWRDTLGKRLGGPVAAASSNFREVDYNRPLYSAIKYDVGQQNRKKYE